MMNHSVAYRLADDSSKTAILQLMKTVYPDYPYDATFFDWQYLNNPAGKAKIFIAERDGKCIGKYTLIPNNLIYSGRHYTLWRIQDVMMHPDHRMRGAFFDLMSYSQLAEHWTIADIFFAFPNEKSYRSFEKFGYTIHSNVTFYENSGMTQSNSGDTDYPAEQRRDFSFLDEPLLKQLAAPEKLFVNIAKDRNFLTWRYLHRPGTHYSCFTVSEGNEIRGYAVLKKYINSQGETLLHICDLKAVDDDYHTISSLVTFALHKTNEIGAVLINSFASSTSLQRALTDFGFQKKITGRNIVFHNGLAGNDDIERTILFSLGDNDLF